MSPEQIAFWDMIGNWAVGIFTLAAVVVSLYLSRKQSKPRLKGSVYVGVIVLPGHGISERGCTIRVVNTGFLKVKIINISWKNRPFNRYDAIQTLYNLSIDSPIPVDLEHGEEAQYFIPFKDPTGRGEDWIKSFPKDFLKYPLWLSSLTLKLQVHISVGKTFTIRPNKSLRKELIEAAKYKE